jgi:hypothetical protein
VLTRTAITSPDRLAVTGRTEIAHLTGYRVGDVQPGGEGTGLVLGAVPADHGQRAAIWPLRHLDDVPSPQAGHDLELAARQVQQPQPVARGALTPHPRVCRARLVPGDDRHPPPVGEGKVAGDAGRPAGQRPWAFVFPGAVQADAVQLAF